MKNSPRFNLVVISGILLSLAAATRVVNFNGVAVEHFDEGVYASNIYMGPPDFQYPFRQLYAPPLFPAILEWLMILSGGVSQSVMLCNLVLGVLLIPAIAWTANELLRQSDDQSPERERRPLGLEPGAIAAAMFATCSELLIQYSRTALTDTSVLFWMTLAVGAGTRGLRRNDWRWVISAGALTALSWWTKYNGWLPLAILGAGIAGQFVFETRSWKLLRTGLLNWLAITSIAIMLWLPCLQALQSTGGYAAVAANHAGYVTGLSHWAGALLRHLEVDHFYSRYLTAAGVLAAIGVGALSPVLLGSNSDRTWTRQAAPILIGRAFGICFFTLTLGLLPALAFWNVTALVLSILDKEPKGNRSSIGHWILLAWILGLLLATPMYRPFPRLILPLLVGLMIGAGYGIQLQMCRLQKRLSASGREVLIGWKLSGLVLGTAIILLALAVRMDAPAYAPREQFRDLAVRVGDAVRMDLEESPSARDADVDALIAVCGEPGLFFHLAKPARRGAEFQYAVQPIGTISPLTAPSGVDEIPTYIVTGPHAREEAKDLEEMPDRVRLVAEVDYQPSPLVGLDDFSPEEYRSRPPEKIQVWTRRR